MQERQKGFIAAQRMTKTVPTHLSDVPNQRSVLAIDSNRFHNPSAGHNLRNEKERKNHDIK